MYYMRMSQGGSGQPYITIYEEADRYHVDREKQTEIENVPLEQTTLIECARCGQLQRVSREELEEIKEYARDCFKAQYNLVAQRDLDNTELVISNQKQLQSKLNIIERI